MYPFHDVFITNSKHPEGFEELRVQDEALMRALSCGPVGIGDKVGEVDKAVVEKLCFPEGKLAKPDRPAQPHWALLKEGLLVAAAETALPVGIWKFVVVYNVAEAPRSYHIDPEELGAGEGVVYNYFRGCVMTALSGRLLPERGDYFVLAPLLEGVALLGFLDKYITFPSDRCQIELIGKGILAKFRAPPNAEYLIGAYSPRALAMEVKGTELVEVSVQEGLHLIRVRPYQGEWTLILRRG
jgi:hypothetical protein